jgi:guanylate kinase
MRHSTNLVIISGPSGAGKDSVIEGLIERGLPVERVITTITRTKRPNEAEGRSYYFISPEEMKRKIENNEMAEWALVYGGMYGVTKEELERVKAKKDKIGIWRIEEQGVRTARKLYFDILTVAITAPLAELMKRSAGRGDEEEEITGRATSKKEWTGEEGLYDYKVENRESSLGEAVDQVVAILKKEGYLI